MYKTVLQWLPRIAINGTQKLFLTLELLLSLKDQYQV